MRTPHKVLYAKDRTLHLVLTNHHPIQTDDEPPTISHWSAHNESCQLENLEKQISVFQITILKPYHIGHDTYFKQTLTSTEASLRTAERRHHLCQGGSSLKTAPAVVAPERRTGIQSGKPRSHCPSPIRALADHRAEDPADEVAHDHHPR